MSKREIDRLSVISSVVSGGLTQVLASEQLGLSVRQVKRLVRRYREDTATGLISRRRGRPSNNKLSDDTCKQAIELIQTHYHDFGPTFAREKLVEVYKLSLSVESVRQLMIKSGLWVAKQQRQARIHQSRDRRSCRGELVQIDGSPHAWFEDRGDKCTLLVFIDDATSELLNLHFVPSETTEGYMEATRDYINRCGRPVAFYSDRYGVFKVNTPGREHELTQYGRALSTLDIELITAHTPQAKGRVERANQTLQDRLIKEMRLRGISTIAEANVFAKEYMAQHNKHFAVTARSSEDAHRKVLHTQEEQDLIFSIHASRKISKNLTFRFECREYQLQGYGKGYRLRHAEITVCKRFSGEVIALHLGKQLAFRIWGEHEAAAPIVETKDLDVQLKEIRAKQQNREKWKPAPDHPWRKRAVPQRQTISQPSPPPVG